MAVQVTQTLDNGDGTLTVYGRNPGGNVAHVVVGRDKLADGSAYVMLEIAAGKLDGKAASLDTQSRLDNEADAHD